MFNRAILLCFAVLAISFASSHGVESGIRAKIGFLNRAILKSAAALTAAGLGASPLMPQIANAFGPVDMQVTVKSYKQVDLCNGKKPIMPGQKAAEGLFPICIEVEATLTNPEKTKSLSDVAVYGFVKENAAGNSVLPNNPDFKSDGGQYAMIKSVVPGENTISYQFVAAVSADPKKEAIPSLTFFKTKAVSFPGGEKFKPLSDCEIDPRSCFDDEEEDQ